MLRIIPVLDVLGGLAVHARGGCREHYRPVRSILRRGADPASLAEAFRDELGLSEVYVADLDAIAGRPQPSGLGRALRDRGIKAWIDAGVRDEDDLDRDVLAGASRIIVGLETIAGPASLERVVNSVGRERIVFSLDLRDGRPIVAPGTDWASDDPEEIVARAVAAGIISVIVLDLGRVGGGTGVGTLALLERLASRHPEVERVAGGGVSGPDDLRAIERAGGSAALVASALHDGRIGRGEARPTGLGVDHASTMFRGKN